MKKLKYLVLIMSSLSALSCTSKEVEKPNIVWITSEDNTAHFLQLYNKNGAATPNIEKLAAKGIVFNNAYSNAPVCSAARSALISGCLNPRIATQYHRCSGKVPMPEGLEFYPKYLQEAGYYTSNNNKEDYNVKGEKGWNMSSKKASYRNRAEGQPFFQVWNILTTHESRVHFPKEDVTTKPTKHAPASIEVFPYHPNTATMRYTYARYLDKHVEMDEKVGEYLSMLEEDGELENTIIFYFGDNGGVLPRSKGYAYDNGTHIPLIVAFPDKYKHLMPAKQGSRVDGFVNFIDFAPTLLQLIGYEVPQEMDGKAFLGKGVKLKELNSRDEQFSYADRFDEKYDMVRSFRKGNFHYVRSYQPFNIDGLHNHYRYKQIAFREWFELYQEKKLNDIQSQFFEERPAEMLFDLSNDPHETINLAQKPEYKEELEELRALLNKQVKSMPDLSFYPEPYLAKKAFENPTSFGQAHKEDIAELIDIANLSYAGYATAKEGIATALKSRNPWKRYWALIVCSTYGEEASAFAQQAKTIAEADDELLVRVRAAEFLALSNIDNPCKTIETVCSQSQDRMEVVLTLNTATLLKMKNPKLNFKLSKEQFPSNWTKGNGNWITNHLNFINGSGLILGE